MRVEQLNLLQALAAAPGGTLTSVELIKALNKMPHSVRRSAYLQMAVGNIITTEFRGYRRQINLRFAITIAGRAAIAAELARRAPKPRRVIYAHNECVHPPAETRYFGNSVFDWRGENARV